MSLTDPSSRSALFAAVLEALTFLSRAYGKQLPDVSESCRAYAMVLDGLEPEQITRGATAAAQEERFFPAPAVLRRFALAIERPRPIYAVPFASTHPDACPVCHVAPAWYRRRDSETGMPRLYVAHEPRAHGWPDQMTTLPAGAVLVSERDVDAGIRVATAKLQGARPLAGIVGRVAPAPRWRSARDYAIEVAPTDAPLPADRPDAEAVA